MGDSISFRTPDSLKQDVGVPDLFVLAGSNVTDLPALLKISLLKG
jgi:hypothetical protein